MHRLLWIRSLCSQLSQGERKIFEVLRARFPNAVLDVKDVSGGCGAMYEVTVEDKEFRNMALVKQHKLVNETLRNEIKDMHGIRTMTRPMK